MKESEIEKEISELDNQMKESENQKKILSTKLAYLRTLKKDLTDLSKRDSELPPGFEIRWFHRHDPFDSVFSLYLHGEYDCMADSDHGDEAQQIQLRKRAWSLWDVACKVLKPIIDEKGNFSI